MCLFPSYIINQRYSIERRNVDFVSLNGIKSDPHSFFSPSFYEVTPHNVRSFYAVTYDGEVIPLFISIPCRKCFECLTQKRNSYKNRMLLEAKIHEDYSSPLHLTLTYSDAFLPSDGVRRSHIQSFLNRFRTYLPRAGYDFTVRHACFSEYSPEKHRAHYHIVLFGVPRSAVDTLGGNDSPYWRFVSVIRKAWPFGFVKLNASFPVSKLQYVCKYACKDSILPPPPGCNSNFVSMSVHNGGLGMPSDKISYLLGLFGTRHSIALPILGTVVRVSIPPQLRAKRSPVFASIHGTRVFNLVKQFYLVTYAFDRFHQDKLVMPAILSAQNELAFKFRNIRNFYWFTRTYIPPRFIVDVTTLPYRDFDALSSLFHDLYDELINLPEASSFIEDCWKYTLAYRSDNKELFEQIEDASCSRYNTRSDWNDYLTDCFISRATLDHDQFLDS